MHLYQELDPLKVVSYLYIIFGAFGVLSSAALTILLYGQLPWSPDPQMLELLHQSGIILMILPLLWITSAASVVVGFGLLQGKMWAHKAGIILSIISLFSFPIGTAMGVFTLWVLMRKHQHG